MKQIIRRSRGLIGCCDQHENILHNDDWLLRPAKFYFPELPGRLVFF